MNTDEIKYIFVDESGDPGMPFKVDSLGKRILTGASEYYILSAICLGKKKLHKLENEITKIKIKYGYRDEIKSTHIPLKMYEDILKLINKLEVQVFYRQVNKKIYRGTFANNKKNKLYNVFDNYNLVKLVDYAVKKLNLINTEIVIDRTDRRKFNGVFDDFDHYLINKINTKILKRVGEITHADSEYVYIMQLSDLVCGAIRDSFTKKNTNLKKLVSKKYLTKVY